MSGSNYYSAFRSLFRDVIEALAEAQNLALHLKPLIPLVETMEKISDIESLSPHFDRLFHLIALVWSHSVYYTNIKRFIGFLQQWTNLVVVKVRCLLRQNVREHRTKFEDSRSTSTERFVRRRGFR